MSQDGDDLGLWHEGEVRVQERVMGVAQARELRREYDGFVRDAMPEQHQVFFEEAPWLVVASLDPDGHPRATVAQKRLEDATECELFRAADDGKTFSLALQGVGEDDPLTRNLQRDGAKIGILGIELATRRRNRVNGEISGCTDGRASFRVMQSFGNCPKYIQARRWVPAEEPSVYTAPREVDIDNEGEPPGDSEASSTLARALDLVRAADTFFIASGNNVNGADASHRGGVPGFVRIADDKTLRWPDYVGNGFFNTLGNIAQDPRVSLLFIDFGTGDSVELMGRAEVSFDKDPELPGAQRVVAFRMSRARLMPGALRMIAPEAPQMSPFNPVPVSAKSGIPVRVTRVLQQTPSTSTFYFASARPVLYTPGQYGTFAVSNAGDPDAEPVVRCWTFSSTPPQGSAGEGKFAITVKHKAGGQASPLLHDMAVLPKLRFVLVSVDGDSVVSKTPEGAAATAGDDDPFFVFAAAGSGVTPAMSNLRRMAMTGGSGTLMLSARTAEEVIFMRELSAIASSRIRIHISLTQVADPQDLPESKPPKLAFHAGRVTAEVIRSALEGVPSISTLHLCGPGSFPADFLEALQASGAPKPLEVMTESFKF